MRSQVPEGYPNINFNYTRTDVPLVDAIPEGYRWADVVETDFWWHIEGAIHVLYNATSFDVAVPIVPGVYDWSGYNS